MEQSEVVVTTPATQMHAIPAVQVRLCVGRTKVFKLIESGELRSVKIGKSRRVSESALREYIEGLEASA
uniref:excisionase family DNA-binding protein n=1 Tax=Rhodococcus qingshengii TaxID=334542 RepID=UPI0009D6D3CF|nr:excisionase family DNA-binding protein [Rhodococcus qingshengii]